MDAKQNSPASAFPASSALPFAVPSPEKSVTQGALAGLFNNPVAATVYDAYQAFNDRRSSLGLSNPGLTEDISREASDVFTNKYMFTGFSADFVKMFNATPVFQTIHKFAMGSAGLPPYSFIAIYGSPKASCQGGLDSDFSLNSRAEYRLTPALAVRSTVALAPGGSQSRVQLEAEYVGADFTANMKLGNPSFLSGVAEGTFVGSYMQSVTKRLALGLETTYQRIGADQPPETFTGYALRYKSDDWIASAQVLPLGNLQATYWRRLAERVEAGLELNLFFLGLSGAAGMMGMPGRNEGVATVGAKYDFRTSTFRGQVDTSGKVSALLQKRIAQPVEITFAGEMDHAKNTARMGMGITIESMGSDEVMEQQERMMQSASQQGPLY